jgi:hypothetical protein
VQRIRTRELVTVQSNERRTLIEDVRKAEQEWNFAEWQFHNALGEDHVDYAIYCLEAAEKKLDMLLRKAKYQWSGPSSHEGSRVMG